MSFYSVLLVTVLIINVLAINGKFNATTDDYSRQPAYQRFLTARQRMEAQIDAAYQDFVAASNREMLSEQEYRNRYGAAYDRFLDARKQEEEQLEAANQEYIYFINQTQMFIRDFINRNKINENDFTIHEVNDETYHGNHHHNYHVVVNNRRTYNNIPSTESTDLDPERYNYNIPPIGDSDPEKDNENKPPYGEPKYKNYIPPPEKIEPEINYIISTTEVYQPANETYVPPLEPDIITFISPAEEPTNINTYIPIVSQTIRTTMPPNDTETTKSSVNNTNINLNISTKQQENRTIEDPSNKDKTNATYTGKPNDDIEPNELNSNRLNNTKGILDYDKTTEYALIALGVIFAVCFIIGVIFFTIRGKKKKVAVHVYDNNVVEAQLEEEDYIADGSHFYETIAAERKKSQRPPIPLPEDASEDIHNYYDTPYVYYETPYNHIVPLYKA